jgi:hypothetical protein
LVLIKADEKVTVNEEAEIANLVEIPNLAYPK